MENKARLQSALSDLASELSKRKVNLAEPYHELLIELEQAQSEANVKKVIRLIVSSQKVRQIAEFSNYEERLWDKMYGEAFRMARSFGYRH